MQGRLTARRVATLSAPGKYGDGRNLWYRIRSDGSSGWVFRYTLRGRAREMGLGPGPDVSLKEARDKAAQARQLLRQGIDPIEARRKAYAARRRVPSFRQCVGEFIAAHEAAWRNRKHCRQWHNTLATYAFPVMGDQPVDAIGTDEVLCALQPIWQAKTETASRVRGRIERVLDWARARGLREGENPARWRGHLDKLLPKPTDVRAVRHHAALAWKDLPSFMDLLRKRTGLASRALEFAILTAARSGEVRGMRWSEVSHDVWTLSARRMKGKREHRVPLSDRALAILDEMRGFGSEPGQRVFPGMRPGRPLSDMSLGAVLKRMGRGDLTVHGFRSTFRDWAAEETHFPREVCEEALAHVLVSKVEAAYRRGDLFEKRRRLMTAWEKYCGWTAGSADVVSIRAKRGPQ